MSGSSRKNTAGRKRRPSNGRATKPSARSRKQPTPRKRPSPSRKRPAPAVRAKQGRRRGVLPQIIALVLVLGLAGAMAIQPTRQLFAQRDRISDMSDDLNSINESNRELNDRVDRLNDPDYLEQIARDSGFARPGETVYNVVPPSRKEMKERAKRKASKSEPAPEPEPSFMERFMNFVGLG
jgi:cell division protein FtsB